MSPIVCQKGLVLCATLILGQSSAAAPQAPTDSRSENVILLQNDDLAFQIGKLLRCPVCQGMPIAESPSSMAQDMMKRVREMVAEGKSREEILDFYVARYGEWVLLEPRPLGFNWLVWVLPPVGLLAGLLIVLRLVRAGPALPLDSKSKDSNSGSVSSSGESDDPYVRAVRQQVEHDS